MHIKGRVYSYLLAIVLAVTFSLCFDLTPGLAADCPCYGGVDNFCHYASSTPGCSMTYPGGYCDPDGDGNFSDADWVRGYYDYLEACPDGGPPPPPPGDDDDDDDDDYSPWIYGIHWYGDDYAGRDVEAMTGGKGIWALETVTIWDGWTINDQLQKFQTIVDPGHTLIIRIQPRWGWSIPAPGAERDQYLDAIEATAQQAKNVCHIWQIGNEMNLYAEYGGGVLSAPEYIDYFKQIRRRIKNVPSPLGPQMVLVGPISPGAYFEEVRHTDGLQYLGQMCDLLEANDFDGFALHAYGAFWEDANGARWDFQNGSGGYAAQLGVIDSYGFYDKPTFILEFNRQTPDEDAWQESQTAQFIIGAYEDLQAWNRNPNNHPIICATWFIYADVGGWEIFSLRHLRDKNQRGVNQDVWDSFQYACSLNIPAGDVGSETPPPPPVDDLDAVHTGNTIPASMEPDQTVQVSVTLKNTGSITWRASSNDRLGAGGDNAFIWSGFATGGYSNSAADQRVFLSGAEAIATGSTKTFTFSITAPSAPGQYGFSARMVRDGVTWFGDTIMKAITVKSTSGQSLTNGEPTGTFGAGGQTDEVTEPEIWRWSEWYYGFKGIDRIEWGTDGCDENHNYAVGWHQNDLIEYRMKFGGDFSRLILRGIADRPGPVNLHIYIDGELQAAASWDNNNDCNQDVAVEIPGIVYGTHAIAIKFVNDYYDSENGADRNFYLDALKVVFRRDQPAISWAYPVGAADTAEGWYLSNPLGNSWYSSQNQRWYRGHLGEDYFKSVGDSYGEPVYASAEGKVITVLNNCGNYVDIVIIEHRMPEFAEPIYSFYGHLETDGYVQQGDWVEKRQQIGTLGDPISFSPHLHFEIKNRTALVNPPFSSCSNIADGIYISAGYSGISDDYDGGDYYDPSDGIPENRYYHPTRFIENHKDGMPATNYSSFDAARWDEP